jgi:hypothetical protein
MTNYVNNILSHPSEATEVVVQLMDENIKHANSIYQLCKRNHMLDSQEFLNWQDGLNEISVRYELE